MIKKIIKVASIVILILLIAVISIPFLFKDKILQMVKDEINNNLNATVDFVSFDVGIFKTFPDLYVELNQLLVVGINDFENDTLLYVPKFTASINLMSVFSNPIKIKSIRLEKPKAHLLVLKNGKANWDIVKESSDTITAEIDTTASNFSLALKKMILENATISYEDQSTDMKFVAQNFNFQLKGDLTADRTQLKTEFSIDTTYFSYEGIAFLNKAKINAQAEIDANLKDFVFTFIQNTFEINHFTLHADGNISMPTDDINIDLSFKSEQNDFKTLLSLVPVIYTKDFESIKTEGNIAFDGTIKGTYNDSLMPGFSLNLKVENASFQYSTLPSSVKNINIDLAVNNKDGNPDNTVIDLKKFHAEMDNNPVDARLFVSTPVSNANLKGSLIGKLDLSKVSAFYPMENTTLKGMVDVDAEYETTMSQLEQEKYDEVKAKGYIKLSNVEYQSPDVTYKVEIPQLDAEITPKYFDLKNFFLKMGHSDIQLKGKVENFMAYLFKDELLKGNFALQSTILNINQLIGTSENTATAETTAADTSSLEAPSIPKNIDFTFAADIKQLLYDNMELSNTQGTIVMKNGTLNLENLQFNTLDGNFLMKASYSYNDVLPEASFTFNMKSIDIKKTYETFSIIKKMVPIAERCQGKINVNLDMSTKLNKDLSPLLNTVNAKGLLSAQSITVENSELGKKLTEFFKNKQYETFKVEQIAANFTIENGNITVEPVKTKIGTIPVEFSGSQNLDQSLNYDMLMNVPKAALGSQAHEIFGQWTGMAQQAGINVKVPDVIPVKGLIRGLLTKPEIKLNLKDMAQQSVETVKEAIKEKINEEVDKAKAEAIRKAQEEADRLMREAEQRANQIISAAEAAAKQINETARQTAQQIRQEADAKATQVEKEGKSKGPIAEKLAKESADKIRKEANKKASDIENKAQQESQAKVNQARAEADKIKAVAKEQGNKLIEEAKKK